MDRCRFAHQVRPEVPQFLDYNSDVLVVAKECLGSIQTFLCVDYSPLTWIWGWGNYPGEVAHPFGSQWPTESNPQQMSVFDLNGQFVLSTDPVKECPFIELKSHYFAIGVCFRLEAPGMTLRNPFPSWTYVYCLGLELRFEWLRACFTHAKHLYQ